MTNNKKISLLLRLLALAAALLTAWSAPSALAEGSATTVKVLTGMQEIRAVSKTGYLLAQDAETGLWGVFNTQGDQLLPFEYQELSYGGCGCFISSLYTDPLENGKALIAPDGRQLSGFRYGVIRVYNGEWAVGWDVSAAEKTDDYDYKADSKHFYFINRCDVFRLGEEPHLAFSLKRKDFAKAAVHGQYLSVADREGKVTVYGPDCEPMEYSPRKVTDALYGIVSYALKDKVTGEVILDGLTEAKELTGTDGRLLFTVARIGYDGVKQYGLLDLSGQWLLPLGTGCSVVSVNGSWAVVSQNKKQGLYSLTQQRLVLPCEFDSIVSSSQTAEPYLFYGYLCAEREGVRYAMDTATGEIVRAYEWDEKHMQSVGGSALYQEFGKRSLISAVGSRVGLAGYLPQTAGGDGRLIVIKGSDNRYGVMTYEGQLLLETHYLNPPKVTPEGGIILNTKNGYELLNVNWE